MNLIIYIGLLLFFKIFYFNFIFANSNIKIKKLIFECQSNKCNKTIYLYGDKESFYITSNENAYFTLQENKIDINNLNLYGTLHTTNFSSYENKQWKLFHINTFDQNDNSWNIGELSVCGNSPDTFIGGPCKLAGKEAYTKISNLPKHEMLNIKLRLHFFDKWNNDSLFIKVDKKIVWTYSNKSCLNENDCNLGINVCGQNDPDRLSVPVDILVHHSSDSINLLIGSTLKSSTDPCFTSWGIDDFLIFYK